MLPHSAVLMTGKYFPICDVPLLKDQSPTFTVFYIIFVYNVRCKRKNWYKNFQCQHKSYQFYTEAILRYTDIHKRKKGRAILRVTAPVPFYLSAHGSFLSALLLPGRRTLLWAGNVLRTWFFLFLIAHKPDSSRFSRGCCLRLSAAVEVTRQRPSFFLWSRRSWKKLHAKNFLWRYKLYQFYRSIDVFYNYTSF